MKILNEIWNELQSTVPVMEITVWLTAVQSVIGAILPIKVLLRSVKRKSKMETYFCCIVPIVILLTNAFAGSLFFGSFLGSGFSGEKIKRLRIILDTWEIFSQLSDNGIKYVIYGIYLLLEKIIFYLTCILFALVFGERRVKAPFEIVDEPQKWLQNYLAHSYRITAAALLLYAAFMFFLLSPDLCDIFHSQVSFFLLLFVFIPAGIGLFCLFFAVFPACLPNYRAILTWGNKMYIMQMLYEELELRRGTVLQYGAVIITKHFLIAAMPKRIYYLSFYEKCVPAADSCYKLYFKDKMSVRLNERLAREVLKQIAKTKSM